MGSFCVAFYKLKSPLSSFWWQQYCLKRKLAWLNDNFGIVVFSFRKLKMPLPFKCIWLHCVPKSCFPFNLALSLYNISSSNEILLLTSSISSSITSLRCPELEIFVVWPLLVLRGLASSNLKCGTHVILLCSRFRYFNLHQASNKTFR